MNHKNLARALDFYVQRRYSYFDDAPWTVSQAACFATKPPDARESRVELAGSVQEDGNYLVASGEQSFLQMLLDGRQIKRGVCMTPCFRDEKKHSGWNLPYFTKVELINADDPSVNNLMMMVHDALSFFEMFLRVKIQVPKNSPPNSFDIVEHGGMVELGSYGIREALGFKWIYGTGCAEPRLSTVVEKIKKAERDDREP